MLVVIEFTLQNNHFFYLHNIHIQFFLYLWNTPVLNQTTTKIADRQKFNVFTLKTKSLHFPPMTAFPPDDCQHFPDVRCPLFSLFYDIERMFSQYLALVFKETKSTQLTFNYHIYTFTNNYVVIKQHIHRVWNMSAITLQVYCLQSFIIWFWLFVLKGSSDGIFSFRQDRIKIK